MLPTIDIIPTDDLQLIQHFWKEADNIAEQYNNLNNKYITDEIIKNNTVIDLQYFRVQYSLSFELVYTIILIIFQYIGIFSFPQILYIMPVVGILSKFLFFTCLYF